MGSLQGRTLFRSKPQSRIIVVGVLVYVALWGVGLVELATSDGGSGSRRAVVGLLVAAHLLFVIWFVGYRCGGAGVLAGPSDVVVRNPWRSHRLSWDKIESFTVESNGPWTQGHLNTREGDSIPIFGIQGQMRSVFPRSRWAEGPISDLNRLLEETRDRQGAAS